MRKTLAFLLLILTLAPLVTGCGAQAQAYTKETTRFFGTFDTIVTIIGYTQDRAVFDRVAAQAQQEFERLHRIFDAYSPYPGVNNVYALNQRAGEGPVPVEPELLDLLAFCKERQPLMGGTVNIAMGTVLKLWHDARAMAEENPAQAALPDGEALLEASQHTSFDNVRLDLQAGTVEITDPLLRLDVGAVAKGYAVELVAQWMLASEMPSFIISAGGNVRAGDPPRDGRLRWGVSVMRPDSIALPGLANDSIETLYFTNASAVTSGDYQRYFTVDGKRYHHIISPQTLMPGDFIRAVTIICEDSGMADLLSTALFLMPYEEGRAFADALEGVDALWVLADGTVAMTDGAAAMAKSRGAGSK